MAYAAAPKYKVISLTDVKLSNSAFTLPSSKIISAIDNGDSTIKLTFLDQDQKVVTHKMNNSISSIKDNARLLLFTLADGNSIYLQMDRIILMNVTATGASVVYHNDLFVEPEVLNVTNTASAVSTSSGGMVLLTSTKTGLSVYVNNMFITMITADGSGSKLMFDNKKVEYTPLKVTQAPAAILTAVNAL